jgi:hypothetical protein
MLGREAERRRVGVQQAGVGDEGDSRRLGGGDDMRVLRDSRADGVRGDQQQPLDPRQRRRQGFRFLVVERAHGDAFGGERLTRRPTRRAGAGDDVCGGNAAQEAVYDELAELSGRAGDEIGCGHAFCSWGSFSRHGN